MLQWFMEMTGMYHIKQKYTSVPLMPPCNSVPTAIPRGLGYHHHGKLRTVIFQLKLHLVFIGVEYWQHISPPSSETTLKCDPEGEDPNGSASIPSQGVNLAHTMVRTSSYLLCRFLWPLNLSASFASSILRF